MAQRNEVSKTAAAGSKICSGEDAVSVLLMISVSKLSWNIGLRCGDDEVFMDSKAMDEVNWNGLSATAAPELLHGVVGGSKAKR